MSRKRVLLTTILSLFLIASPSVLAEESIANVSLDDTGLSFAMKRAGDATLVVSGPNKFHFQQTFSGGAAPSLSIFNKDGGYLTAGSYSWTLTLHREAKGDRLANGSLEQPMSLSGSFTLIEAGGIANPNLIEDRDALRIPEKAQVINNDLVVVGSACVGLDCVNGESFGFDTLRLKENNLRIHFNDTSNSASFPQNDWRIVANDTTNGGANYLALEDSTAGRIPFRVEAGAPVNTLYVEADGDVGVKTANPVVDIHVVEGNTPTLRLEQDGSDGFTPQTYDIAANEANFFIRDVTNGSALFFRSKPGAPEDSIFIDADGDVGIGTDSPDADLDVQSGNPQFRLTGTNSGAEWVQAINGSGRWSLNFADTGNGTIKVDADAPDNGIVVGDAGVGIGTNTPTNASVAGEVALDVNGPIFQRSGGTPLFADYVFDEAYELESIEEHAEFMWTNKHLPAVPARQLDAEGREVLEIGAQHRGMLEELEKAHIYIQQLNEQLTAKTDALATVQERLERLEALLSE
ncbi:MAG: hypothetical protein AAF560_28235 [Acidobacteriota bacterium]